MPNFKPLPPGSFSYLDPPEVLIIPFFRNEIIWLHDVWPNTVYPEEMGTILQNQAEGTTALADSVRDRINFEAKWKEICILYPPGKARKVYLLGLGERANLSKAHQAFRSLAFKHQKDWGKSVTISVGHIPVEILSQVSQGLELARYSTRHLDKQLSDQPSDITYYISNSFGEKGWKRVELGQKTAHTQAAMMRLVDLPANIKTPQFIADYAKVSSLRNRYSYTRFEMGDLAKNGLHAVLAVGQGSIHPPVMIQLEYNGTDNDDSRPQLGLVGKGVTFDTGGISIKGAANMHYMKSDMGGAAAVLGAVEMAAKFKLPIHLIAAIPLVENSVDAHSIKPGDVINSYSGKTIEVINTDAEGRLIMADALAWLHKNYKPEILMDLATLTGDCVRALGYEAAGLFSNNAELIEELKEAGSVSHERLWEFPMWEEYGKDLHSDVADVKNIGSRPIYGAIFAGKFLESFVKDHPKWAHIDMAGVAFGDSEFTKTKSATGYGIQLLFEFMKKISIES